MTEGQDVADRPTPGFGDAFHEKRISLESMDPSLRTLTLVALAALVLAALAVAMRELPLLPPVSVGRLLGGDVRTTAPVLLLASGLLALAWSYLLAGALHSHLAIRVVTLLAYSCAMALIPVLAGGTAVAGLGDLVAIGGLWIAATALWVRDRWADRDERRRTRHHRDHLRLLTTAICAVATIWVVGSSATAGSLTGLGTALTGELLVLLFCAFPVMLLAGSDFAEWGEVAATQASGRLGSWVGPRVRGLLAAVVALVLLADGVKEGGLRSLAIVALTAAPSCLLAGLLGWLLLRRRERGEGEVPFWAPVLGALGIFAFVAVTALAAGSATAGRETSPALVAGIAATAPGATVAGTLLYLAALVLVRRGGRWGDGALYLGVSAAFFVELPVDLGVRRLLHVPLLGTLVPQPTETAVEVLGALALLGMLLVLAVGRGSRRLVAGAELLLVLLGGTVALRLLYGLYADLIGLGARSAAVQGVVLLLAMLWDVATSGAQITNVYGRHVPRHSRVLLYLGYSLLAACAVLFFSSLRQAGSGAPAAEWLETDTFPQYGVDLLGLPLLVTFFLLNLRRRWSAGSAPETETVDRTALAE